MNMLMLIFIVNRSILDSGNCAMCQIFDDSIVGIMVLSLGRFSWGAIFYGKYIATVI